MYVILDMDGAELARAADAREAWAEIERRWPRATVSYDSAHGRGMSALYDLANHAAVDGRRALISDGEERVGWADVQTEDERRLDLIDLGLSPNEARAVAWVEAGRPQADLARELGVTPQAVASYLRRAEEKLANLDAMG